MTNKPYVKIYDENGRLTNPINGFYRSLHPNRRARKEKIEPFMNNCIGVSNLIVKGRMKFKKFIQLINGKQIFHTIHIPSRIS